MSTPVPSNAAELAPGPSPQGKVALEVVLAILLSILGIGAGFEFGRRILEAQRAKAAARDDADVFGEDLDNIGPRETLISLKEFLSEEPTLIDVVQSGQPLPPHMARPREDEFEVDDEITPIRHSTPQNTGCRVSEPRPPPQAHNPPSTSRRDALGLPIYLPLPAPGPATGKVTRSESDSTLTVRPAPLEDPFFH